MQGRKGSVGSIMVTDLTTVLPGTPVIEVSRLMLDKHIRCVLVSDENGNLEGIVTDSDIVFAAAGKAGAHLEAPISGIMTKNPHTVDPDTDIYDVVATMGDKGFRRMPVVKDGKVVGVVSIRDIVRDILKNLGSEETD